MPAPRPDSTASVGPFATRSVRSRQPQNKHLAVELLRGRLSHVGNQVSERVRKDSVGKGRFTNIFDIDYLGFPKLRQGLDFLDQIIEQLMLPPVESPASSSGTCGKLERGRGGV